MDLKLIFNHSLHGAEYEQVRGDFYARSSQCGLQKCWLKDKIIFWEKFETQAFHPDRKYDEERKGEGGKRVLNYHHSSEASISNSFLSWPDTRKSDGVSDFDSI